MNAPQPFVSIILPVFNEETNLAACLDSLFESTYPKEFFEVILVDNGSTDNSIQIANNYDVTILNKPNVKVGAVRNFGVQNCQGEIVVFLDSDCLVEPSWLGMGVDLIIEEKFDAVGGLFLLRDEPAWIEKNWILRSSRSYVYQNTFIGACIFIKADVFNQIGGFNESLSAGEDCFLTEQLRENGYKIKVAPKLGVIHLGYPTTIPGFVRRQVWHSSDYINNIKHIFSDKTMFLVFLYICTLTILAISLVMQLDQIYVLSILVVLLSQPFLLTVKRIIRYGSIKDTSGLISIYLVDCLYLTARAIGFMKGLIRLLSNKKDIKIIK